MDAIAIEGLKRVFGAYTAVDDLTLHIATGSVFGFLGPNGAGKTTTVRMLAALIAPTAGIATIAGHTLGQDNEAIRRSVGILTETPGLYEPLSAWQNLLFFARLYDLSDAQAAAQTERYLRMLELWERRGDKVGSFSKGMRQKLAIARALLHEPPVIFLDEPTSGLDPEAARTVRDFIRQLRADGRTIFLTTHNLAEAEELCDLIGIFRTKLLRLDSPARLRAEASGRGTVIEVQGEASGWEATIRALPCVKTVTSQGSVLTVAIDDPEQHNPALVAALVTAGAPIRYVQPVLQSLEDVYLKLVGHHE